ncbi:MAG: hypothetical protein K8J08_07685 [Thermoanaerobaculia bacterium]|nr:hypothetical protein [Thermoanaerobaculia bacterium]
MSTPPARPCVRFVASLVLHLGPLVALAAVSNPAGAVPAVLGLLGVSFGGLILLSRSGDLRLRSLRWLMGVALLGRLALLPVEPVLSNDVWRYLWDGEVAARGLDPYRLAPDAPELIEYHDSVWERLDHRSIPTVYPPLAITAWSLVARLPGALWWWKLMLIIADLVACRWVIRLVDREGLSRCRVIWYLWNPMVMLEVAGMGHVDALGVAASVLAVGWLQAKKPRIAHSAVAAAAGVLAKLGPIVAWPLWARQSGRPQRYVLVATSVAGLALWPVLAPGLPSGWVTYAVSWEFNGPLYEPLWRSVDSIGLSQALASLVDSAKATVGHHEMLNLLYPWLYPQFLAKAMLGVLALVVIARSLRRREVVGATGELFAGLLLCSATVYPWYLLWVLPWAVVVGHRAWIWLSGAILLAYWPQFGGIDLWPWMYLAIWLPFLVLAVIDRRRGRGAWTTE